MLDAPQMATSSRLPEDGKTADVPEVPDTPCEDTEEVIHSTRGPLPGWDAFGLHHQLIRALCNQSFTNPTPIQLKALPPALQGRDVVGVAETVRCRLLPLAATIHTDTGIGENVGVRTAYPTQTPLAEEEPGTEDPQAGARVDPSPHSRTGAPNIITLERLFERYSHG